MKPRHLVTTCTLCFFVSACGPRYITDAPTPETLPPLLNGEQPTPSEPEPLRPIIEPTATLPPPLPTQSLPAAVALRDQAKVATTANDYSRAIGLLERALRISPDDPQTFYDLASNLLAMNQPQEALQLARRGLSLNPTAVQRSELEQLVSRSQAMM